MHDHSLCTCVYRILAGTFRMQSTGCTSSTTVVEDVLLARAENMRGLVMARCARITSLTQISKRKHDNTHRKWFKEILVASVGMSACAFACACSYMYHDGAPRTYTQERKLSKKRIWTFRPHNYSLRKNLVGATTGHVTGHRVYPLPWTHPVVFA